MPTRVVIIGAGPGGALLAALLAKRSGERIQIEVYDFRPDPRGPNASTSYSVILGARGFPAIRQAGLAAFVDPVVLWYDKVRSVDASGQARVVRTYKRKMATVDRTALTAALVDGTCSLYGGRVRFAFGCRCVGVDLAGRVASFQREDGSQLAAPYDVLVGADGVHSAVREAMAAAGALRFTKEPGPSSVVTCLARLPAAGPAAAIDPACATMYPRAARPRGAGRLPTVAMALTMPSGEPGTVRLALILPADLLAAPEDAPRLADECFPQLHALTRPRARELAAPRPWRSFSVRSTAYSYGDSAFLIGDAAHAVLPTIGVGCSAALEDGLVFDRLVEEKGGDLRAAVAGWTTARKRDGDAAVALSHAFRASPLRPLRLALLGAAMGIRRAIPGLFGPDIMEASQQTLEPFSSVWRSFRLQEAASAAVVAGALGALAIGARAALRAVRGRLVAS